MLGKRRADSSPLLSVSELRDGIVTFEDGDDAERYGNLLEADGHMEVGPFVDDTTISLQPVCREQSLGRHMEV